MSDPLLARPRPCPTCPYRRDVPSGVWDETEYAKLPGYDGETGEQTPHLFMCHQQSGHLCSGWLACHDPQELLAIRLGVAMGRVDPAVLDYSTSVPLFGSGAEAYEHGMQDLSDPGLTAQRAMDKIIRKRRAQP